MPGERQVAAPMMAQRAAHGAPGQGADGRPLGRAGVLAASMWIGGVGARLAFVVAAGNGADPAIARFSVAHHITGSSAWIAALVMMALADVLTRLVVIYLRGRRLGSPRHRRPGRRLTVHPPLRGQLSRSRHSWPRLRRPRTPQGPPRRGTDRIHVPIVA